MASSKTYEEQWKKLNQNTLGEPDSSYGTLSKDLLNAYLNREAFSYDFNADPLYQQYRDQYVQQGQLAMQDTMANAAALSGGYGNSYAATAGNQAYQQSLSGLNNVIPELYQAAYNRYATEGQNMREQAALAQTMDDQVFNQWVARNTLRQNDAANAYNMYDRTLEHEEFNKELDKRDKWNDAQIDLDERKYDLK